MPMNRVQFQKGLSMPEFLQRFGTEEQCERALVAARWPAGYACPACGHAHARTAFVRLGRRYWQCAGCQHQCSVTSGTSGLKLIAARQSLRVPPTYVRAVPQQLFQGSWHGHERRLRGSELTASDVASGSAAPVGLIELLTYRLHQMPIGTGKICVTALEKVRVLWAVALRPLYFDTGH
jgi:ribosomal protein L37AE/L43A